jgi:hypothetical protein
MNAVLVPPQPKIYHITHVDRLPCLVPVAVDEVKGFLDQHEISRAASNVSLAWSKVSSRPAASSCCPRSIG